jgi:hypothetical protein
MQNRVRLEIVDGSLKGKRFEFAEHDTFIFGRAFAEKRPFLDGGATAVINTNT